MSALSHPLTCGLTLTLALTLVASTPGWAEHLVVFIVPPQVGVAGDTSFGEEPAKPMALLSVSPRYGIGGDSPLGEEQKESFQLYDIAALVRLPWGWWRRASAWGLETRLIASVGELTGAKTSSLMATLVPGLALSNRSGSVSIDVGLGPGFFSNHRFGAQDFGGPVQIVGTAGVGFDPLPGFHAGYRFQHFSDAGVYGSTSLGVDMHILEIGYRF
ncbi:MAG: acyloxyacyl hydrolase [Nitrospiraceae bacterium]